MYRLLSAANQRCWPTRYRRSMALSAAGVHHQPTRLVALDFDGVVCDSVGESSLTAIKAATQVWPELLKSPEFQSRTAELVEKMRAVRPVIETGYENIVQIRCLYEGIQVDDILSHWGTILPTCMEKWALDRKQLVELFGNVRDDWIDTDLQGWLAPNRIYPGVADAVRAAMTESEVYIVTTKQAHFTELLLRDMAGINFAPQRIYSQTLSGRPKSEVLSALQAAHPRCTKHIFVEDKLSTLEKVSLVSELTHWQLFLVDWGYNTAAERERAAQNPRISVIDIEAFRQLLS